MSTQFNDDPDPSRASLGDCIALAVFIACGYAAMSLANVLDAIVGAAS